MNRGFPLAVIAFLFAALPCVSQPVHRLEFLSPPNAVSENQPFAPTIQVAVVDAAGHLVTSDTGPICIGLKSESGVAGVIVGITEQHPVNGVATFTDLSVRSPGSFRLVAYKPVRLVGRWSDELAAHPDAHSIQRKSRPQHNEQPTAPIFYTDVWGEGNTAFLGSWNPGGVNIIDITDPANPVLAYHWHPDTERNQINDPKTQNGIGFFASDDGGGVWLVDLADPYHPVDLSLITAAQNGFDRVHNLFVTGPFLYLASFRSPDVAVFDISNPSQPVFIRKILSAHEPPVHDITVQDGRMISSSMGLDDRGYTEIYDVSNIREGFTRLGDFLTGISTHSNWPTADRSFLTIAQEAQGKPVSVWNIQNPAQPRLVTSLTPMYFNEAPYSPHNPLIMNNRLYVSWYQAGLQVFDIQDPEHPRLVGFYDTFPQSQTERFQGAWGVYPFLGPDRVLIGDTSNGLFILDTSATNAEVAVSDVFQVQPPASIRRDEWLRQ